MRIAVTGASGFTGRYLLPELHRRGHVVMALTADLTDPGALAADVERCAPDAIVHLAARAFAGDDAIDQFHAVNQIGSFHLLDAAARHAPGAHVVLASTAQVYGAQASGLIDEAQPMQPANHYALSKAAMELGSRLWADRLRLTIARPFNYTGAGQETRYLIPKIVDHVRRREPTIELGNIDVRRDFGDVRSVAEAYAGLVTIDPAGDRPAVYNICTGTLLSVRDIIARLEAMTGHTIEIRINPRFVRANDVPVLGGHNDALCKALHDWRPRTIDETLRWMIDAPAEAAGEDDKAC